MTPADVYPQPYADFLRIVRGLIAERGLMNESDLYYYAEDEGSPILSPYKLRIWSVDKKFSCDQPVYKDQFSGDPAWPTTKMVDNALLDLRIAVCTHEKLVRMDSLPRIVSCQDCGQVVSEHTKPEA